MSGIFESLVPLFGIVFTFGIPGLIIFWAIYSRHRERMRLIEKGISPDDAKHYFDKSGKNIITKPVNPFAALKWGILLAFLGLGIFISQILSYNYDIEDGFGFGIIILALGLGALLYYFILSAKLKQSSSEISRNEQETK
ncbi:MAG: hypothetical protein FJ216_00810 [Ignavibacteria bacterium]|nr:hypothetical protein [Ignavibacteria bacterium]